MFNNSQKKHVNDTVHMNNCECRGNMLDIDEKVHVFVK